jgi:hypothetical protein
MKPEDAQKAIEKAEESVRKGWAAGPFPRPPFPNPRCMKQAIITKSFTIPKHKWLDDGTLRLIFHKSFPLGKSINSLTPRHDIASYFPPGVFRYFSLKRCITIVAEAGPGSPMIQFDASDAYKQVQVQDEDCNEQTFVAGDQYYVDLCACFGSLYGNDIYSAFGNAHCMCLRKAINDERLEVFVDNYFHITPFQGPSTAAKAMLAKTKLEKELKARGPTTKTQFLGWIVDTLAMTITIPPERAKFLISYITAWREKTSYNLKDLSLL